MKFAKIEVYDPDISKIHEQNFDYFWKDSEFIELLSKSTTLAYKIELDNKIQSFVIMSYVSDEIEILTFATHHEYQRRGLAKALLSGVLGHLKSLKASTVFLEVAVDNVAALSLYQTFGFEPVGVRKAYYSRKLGPPVDGQVLRLKL